MSLSDKHKSEMDTARTIADNLLAAIHDPIERAAVQKEWERIVGSFSTSPRPPNPTSIATVKALRIVADSIEQMLMGYSDSAWTNKRAS